MVSVRSLLMLEGVEQTYCEFGTRDPPNLEHCFRAVAASVIRFDQTSNQHRVNFFVLCQHWPIDRVIPPEINEEMDCRPPFSSMSCV